MLNISENNGTEEIGLVTPTPDPAHWGVCASPSLSNTPFITGAAIFVPVLCDHKTGQVAVMKGTKGAERLPWSLKGSIGDVQRSPMDAMVAVKFWACSKQSHRGRRGGRSLKGGRRIPHASPLSQNGCTGVGHWSPRKKCVLLYSLYTGVPTFLPPLYDHKTGQVAVEGRKEAERLPWSFNGGTQDVQISPWTPWSPWCFEHVQNSCTNVAEEVGRSQVAQRRQEEGTHIAVVAEWMHSGRPLVALLKKRTVVNIVYQFEQRFCLPCTTIVPPLADQ